MSDDGRIGSIVFDSECSDSLRVSASYMCARVPASAARVTTPSSVV
jgi:hypothetical protein